jgi:hypothetical protein
MVQHETLPYGRPVCNPKCVLEGHLTIGHWCFWNLSSINYWRTIQFRWFNWSSRFYVRFPGYMLTFLDGLPYPSSFGDSNRWGDIKLDYCCENTGVGCERVPLGASRVICGDLQEWPSGVTFRNLQCDSVMDYLPDNIHMYTHTCIFIFIYVWYMQQIQMFFRFEAEISRIFHLWTARVYNLNVPVFWYVLCSTHDYDTYLFVLARCESQSSWTVGMVGLLGCSLEMELSQSGWLVPF